VDSGGSEAGLKASALIGCIASGLLLIGILNVWPFLLGICTNLIVGIEAHGFSISAFRGFRSKEEKGEFHFSSRKKDLLVLFGQSLTTSLSMPTAFLLNLLAIRFPAYQASLVQSATVISGIGNL